MNVNSNLTLHDFEAAAQAHPEATRFVLKKEEGKISIVPHTGSFLGTLIRWITGKESVKNRAFLEAFKQAWQQDDNTPINWSSFHSPAREHQLSNKGIGAHYITDLSVSKEASPVVVNPMMPPAIARPVDTKPITAVKLTRNEEIAQNTLVTLNECGLTDTFSARNVQRRAQTTLKSKTPLKEVTAEISPLMAEISPLMAEAVTLDKKSISQKIIPVVEAKPLVDQGSIDPSSEVHSDRARPLTDLESAREQTTLIRQNRANRTAPLPFIKEPPAG